MNDNYMGHSPSGAHILSATQKVPIILQERPTTAPYPKSQIRLHPRTLFLQYSF